MEKVESQTRNQFLATIIANGTAFSGGLAFGWSSPINAQIIADEYGNCLHDFCVSKTEMAWIASCLSIGSLALGFLAGPIMSKNGRKLAMIAYSALSLSGWGLLTFAQASWVLFLGRLLVGAGFGGGCVILPVYIGEIADTQIRGKLIAFIQAFIQLGIVISYGLGYFYPIFTQNLMSLILVGVFCVAIFIIPESPRYFVSLNKIKEAEESIKWLRGANFNTDKQIQEMIDFQKNTKEAKNFTVLFTEKANCKAIFITMALILGLQFSGINPIIFYTAAIFQDANISIEPDLAVIFVGILGFVATIISSMFVDKAGRKALLYLSFSIMFLCTTIMGAYFELRITYPIIVENLTILPVITLCIYIFVNMVGACPITFVLTGEIFAQNVKDIASGIVNTWSFFLSVCVTLIFPFLANSFGFGVAFILFSFCSAATFIFIMLMVPETKGKSFQEIQNLFLKKSGQK